MRAVLFLGLLLVIVPPFASAEELWTNIRDGFGAMFPDKPVKVGAATSQGSGYAYQSAKSFLNGAALYAITVVPVPLSIEPNSFRRFLAESHKGFVKSMGGDPNGGEANWLSFGDGRERLTYDFDFTYSGIPFTGQGFSIIDKGRAIRVSVSYTKSLTPEETDEVLLFPQSFVLLTD